MTASTLKSGVVAMTAANAVVLAVVAISYVLYSRLMTPAEFGLYAGALAIAKLGQTVLDGGLKIALVKHPEAATPGVQRALFIGSASAGVLATVLLGAILSGLAALQVLTADSAAFLSAYGAAYFLTYPFLFIPLAQLERRQRFGPVAWAEATSMLVEYALPALLWLYLAPGFWSFVLAAWAGRMLRTAIVLANCDDGAWLAGGARPAWRDSQALLREGMGLQIAVSLSLLRDNLHLLLVGPWFGKEWAGFYAWAQQLCAVTSQVFVQTATRVALPALRLMHGSEARWKATLTQIAWLTIFTAPPLVFLTDLGRAANEALFDGKWGVALGLLPFLIVRMLPSLATTPLGSLVLADRGARAYAIANAWWTGGEVVVAALLVWQFGPIGLAWNYAFMAWFGAAAFVWQLLPPARFGRLLPPLLLRPSLWAAVAATLAYRWGVEHLGLGTNLASVAGYGALGMLVCVASEPRCWQVLLPRAFGRPRVR